MTTHDAVIVGAGPAGLAAASALRGAGAADVVLLERAAEPGGIPRYCGHTGFGIGDFRRLMRGPEYARAMAAQLSGVTVRTNTTVLGIEPKGVLRLSTPDGVDTIAARAILLATGTRETPRAARLVSGARPWGVTTTGAFQEIVYTGGRPPFVQPVIVGAEWVGFSNLLTARHAGVRPVAIIEEGARARVRGPAGVIVAHVNCRTAI